MAGPRVRLEPYKTIGRIEARNLNKALKAPLSGYIGGVHKGGYWVERLKDNFEQAFKAYAVPCNSATSGLLAACMAIGIGRDTEVWTTCYSMSATASVAKVLGANVRFLDIEPVRFSLDIECWSASVGKPRAIIVTNLFGHPAHLHKLRTWCDEHKVWMIEDNAQSPFAMEDGEYAGTIGHIGVFSFNVHKHIQSGEGGVVVTRDLDLHQRLCGAINHGELNGGSPGLNLRMAEPIAAIACAQFERSLPLMASRIIFAEEITDMVAGIDWITPPHKAPNCQHVYYIWAAKIVPFKRQKFVDKASKAGIPMRCGYAPLLTDVFGTDAEVPVARKIQNEQIVVFEVCAYDPTGIQRKTMREIIKRTAGEVDEDRRQKDQHSGAAVHYSGDFG